MEEEKKNSGGLTPLQNAIRAYQKKNPEADSLLKKLEEEGNLIATHYLGRWYRVILS